ncbi:hypothetical protein AAVH_19157 [Aphelenchoides avenae]|nr:hypothetical protein AAVH_19157 [Aphelenchus avenae]
MSLTIEAVKETPVVAKPRSRLLRLLSMAKRHLCHKCEVAIKLDDSRPPVDNREHNYDAGLCLFKHAPRDCGACRASLKERRFTHPRLHTKRIGCRWTKEERGLMTLSTATSLHIAARLCDQKDAVAALFELPVPAAQKADILYLLLGEHFEQRA